jgi:hypothetical protein
MSYINSFPTTKRGSVNKLLTENSLTRLINRLLDVDGFIISDGISTKQGAVASETIGNGGKHLEINTNLNLDNIAFREDSLEFVIRGYYFSTDIYDLLTTVNWNEYVESHSTVDKIGLFARIFIDNTNKNYPELVGQTAYELNDNTDTSTSGAQYYYALSESNNPYYGVQFFICDLSQDGSATNKPTPYHPSIPTETIDNKTVIQNLGTDYMYYDLLLLEYIRNDDIFKTGSYIPFDSLSKFDSHSSRIIDGGMF